MPIIKKIFIWYLFLLSPATGFALSCPNNATILDYGESTQQVLKECGQPSSQVHSSHTITVNKPITEANYSYDNQMFLIMRSGRPYQQRCITIVLGDNYTKSNCTNTGFDIRSPIVCELITRTADSTTTTVFPCNNPPTTPVFETITVTEFIYKALSPNTLFFENDKLSGWK